MNKEQEELAKEKAKNFEKLAALKGAVVQIMSRPYIRSTTNGKSKNFAVFRPPESHKSTEKVVNKKLDNSKHQPGLRAVLPQKTKSRNFISSTSLHDSKPVMLQKAKLQHFTKSSTLTKNLKNSAILQPPKIPKFRVSI